MWAPKWARRHRDEFGGEAARQRSQEHLDAARKQRPEVEQVAGSLRELRGENHFADKIGALIRGGTG